MRRFIIASAFGLIMFQLSACITHRDRNPHNDVLIFGTTTKVALDVSAPVQNAAIPEFTLGYKRLEAVWMPLKPEGGIDADPSFITQTLLSDLNDCSLQLQSSIPDDTERAKFCLTALLPADKYVSLASGVSDDKGGTELEIDTYSVFASLGARGGLSVNSASGNLAQFFATGIAAQRLGANPTIGQALNAQAPEAAAKQAEAQIAQSAEVQALLDGGATPEQAAALASGTEASIASLDKELTESKACAQAWDGSPPAALTDANAINIASNFHADEATLISLLRQDDVARKAIITACKA